MIRSVFASICAAALLAFVPAAAQDASVPAEGLDWYPFEQALDRAKESKKKIIVDVYAQWCPWCRRLQRDVYTDEKVREYVEEHFVLTRLDAENVEDSLEFKDFTLTQAELSAGLGAQGFPTTVFLSSDSEYITRLPGFVEAPDFLHVLSYIGSDAFVEQTYEEYTAATKE